MRTQDIIERNRFKRCDNHQCSARVDGGSRLHDAYKRFTSAFQVWPHVKDLLCFCLPSSCLFCHGLLSFFVSECFDSCASTHCIDAASSFQFSTARVEGHVSSIGRRLGKAQ